MDLQSLIPFFILAPVIGFLCSLIIPARFETAISHVAFATASLNLAGIVFFLAYRNSLQVPAVNLEEFALYQTDGYAFVLDFYFDRTGAVFLFTGALLTFVITRFSKYYMHREPGYKRFFNTVLFFYSGFNFTILAGNFETLFIGWEILGISSFLLIAFYRDRYLPVRNAVRVFSIYRIGDVGLFLAMWASHHLWHENITFSKLNQSQLVHEHLLAHTETGIFISLMILIPAMAKSAQFPFSSWLPRAMEGPTPSSAIFYGSLSVHVGAFLLIRTFPFWSEQTSVRFLIGFIGLLTAFISFTIARVQSSIKSKIAYSSISQIGLIFIEIAAGWHGLALLHFMGNAFLRTYQLLVSPSLVSYLIRDQFYHFNPHRTSGEERMPVGFGSSLYVLSLREWNLDGIMNRYAFRPFKYLGHELDFLGMRLLLLVVLPLYFLLVLLLLNRSQLPELMAELIPIAASAAGLLMVLKAFSERRSPFLAWSLVIMNHLWMALSVSFNEHFDADHTVLYLSGVAISGATGYVTLFWIRRKEPDAFNLNAYYGLSYAYPLQAFIFLLSALGVMGFPITSTFIGEDVIFSHVHETQYFLAFAIALGFVLSGIALIRVYARLFLGPHYKTDHPTSLRAS